MDILRAIDRKPKGFVLKVVRFVKNRQEQKMTQRNHDNCLTKFFLQLVIYTIMSIILV